MNPIYNADGTLSKFRIVCLLVIAVCMLAYGWLNFQAESSADTRSAANDVAAAQTAQEDAGEGIDLFLPAKNSFVQAKVAAIDEFFESISFYNLCGSLNKGYEGCRFKYSDAVTSLYNVEAEASDDGFILNLKLIDPQKDTTCTAMSYSSSGDLFSYDEQGNHTEQQCFLEVDKSRAGVVQASDDEHETEVN
ncbi:MAG: hypothetical protein K6F05_05490 [Succinivibrio sp.]|nr:hypothetical protein [Succinivibrio sp.]